MKNIFILVFIILFFASCGSKTPKPNPGLIPYDAKVGVGKFDKITVDIKLDEAMGKQNICYKMFCLS